MKFAIPGNFGTKPRGQIPGVSYPGSVTRGMLGTGVPVHKLEGKSTTKRFFCWTTPLNMIGGLVSKETLCFVGGKVKH